MNSYRFGWWTTKPPRRPKDTKQLEFVWPEQIGEPLETIAALDVPGQIPAPPPVAFVPDDDDVPF